ncbi:sjoegren syndrome nuclear autoantigen 1 homolog [Clonorchis sinensis]|uniref:Sjoegren syndrome nuclear autoantigen 1 homolog n=1 Tax=Clonorchis sinensis TaxID=79923 RepID=H2KVN4_CLOSI|nr:sjoegren syndrome nuclear autoantigen 1 homolog [Clonorchis sinensis]
MDTSLAASHIDTGLAVTIVEVSDNGCRYYDDRFVAYSTYGFEDLCKRREELQRQIQQDETERARLQREINVLSERLTNVNESLQKKLETRSEYDRTIAESETAYMKACCTFVPYRFTTF